MFSVFFFFKVDRYFAFIMVSAENSALQKFVVHNSRRILKAISEIVGNSVLIPKQNSLTLF